MCGRLSRVYHWLDYKQIVDYNLFNELFMNFLLFESLELNLGQTTASEDYNLFNALVGNIAILIAFSL